MLNSTAHFCTYSRYFHCFFFQSFIHGYYSEIFPWCFIQCLNSWKIHTRAVWDCFMFNMFMSLKFNFEFFVSRYFLQLYLIFKVFTYFTQCFFSKLLFMILFIIVSHGFYSWLLLVVFIHDYYSWFDHSLYIQSIPLWMFE